MAKRRTRNTRRRGNQNNPYLNVHDENKVMFFTVGLVFSTGLAASLLGVFYYGLGVAVTIAVMLGFLDGREKFLRNAKTRR
ncbi:MAG: hypothetical protein V1802_01615 [Candidatus Aenigmatarchaeota archaeon]